MRPPNPRLADDGTGPDQIVIFTVGIDPAADADEEGNWLHVARPTGATYTGCVVGGQATLTDANGTEMSVAGYGVTLFTTEDPKIRVDTPVGWRGLTLSPVGDSVAAGPGAWGFQATESGPDPGGTGLPYEG